MRCIAKYEVSHKFSRTAFIAIAAENFRHLCMGVLEKQFLELMTMHFLV